MLLLLSLAQCTTPGHLTPEAEGCSILLFSHTLHPLRLASPLPPHVSPAAAAVVAVHSHSFPLSFTLPLTHSYSHSHSRSHSVSCFTAFPSFPLRLHPLRRGCVHRCICCCYCSCSYTSSDCVLPCSPLFLSLALVFPHVVRCSVTIGSWYFGYCFPSLSSHFAAKAVGHRRRWRRPCLRRLPSQSPFSPLALSSFQSQQS